MSLRSVVDIVVNDADFQRFASMFARYQSSLGNTSGVWERVAEASEVTAAATASTALSMNQAVAALNKLSVSQASVSRTAESQSSSWHSIADSAFRFASHIADATRSLLRWGALTGVISGILGGGGLFGIERLAQFGGEQRSQSLKLGMKPGDALAFESELGSRGFNADAFLANINTGMHQLTSPQYLGLNATGMTYAKDMQGKDTATVALDALTKLKRAVDQLPDDWSFMDLAHARNLDQLMSMEDLQQLRRTPSGEVGEYAQKIAENQKSLRMPDETAKKWQDLQDQFTTTWNGLKTTFVNRLVELAPQIQELSKAVEGTIKAFIENPKVALWIHDFAQGIKYVADYIMADDFKDKVNKFVDGVARLAEALANLIEAIGSSALQISRWIGGNPDNTVKDEKPNPYPQGSDEYWQYYKEHPRDLRTPWNSGGFYNWWHGQPETPPPTGVQKERFDQLEGLKNLPPGLLNGVFQAESGGGKNLFSPAGAIGPFQFTEAAWKIYGNGGNPFSFEDSSAAAARYFHKLLVEFHGDVAEAAAGYNAGEGNVESAIAKYGADWRRGLPKPEETIPYVDRVVRALGAQAPGIQTANTGMKVTVNVHNNTGGNAYVSSSQLIA